MQKEMRGLTTAWLEAGPTEAEADLPLVILFHGFPDAPECWEHQIAGFSARYPVVAPYVRGAGPSEKSESLHRYGPDSVALDALAILDQVDPERRRRVFIVGHDLGTVHAWHLAGLLRDRAAGLVAINGLTIKQMLRRWRNPRQHLKSWYIYLMQVPVLPETVIKRFSRRFLGFAHRKGQLSPDRRPEAETVTPALTGPLNQYRAFLRDAPKALRSPHRRLACPVLVVFGEQDAFLEPPTIDELKRDASDLTVRILPGNHWLHREDHEKVNRLLLDFFKRHEVRPT